MFDVESMVRVVPTNEKGMLGIGPVALDLEGGDLEKTVQFLRTWLERQLLGAYSRYSAELRDRLRWRTGVGAAETMEQVVRLVVDLEEVRFDNLGHKQRIEGLESELISMRGIFGMRVQEHEKAIKALLAASQTIEHYRKVLRAIADSSSDAASRLAAEGILYREGGA